MARSPILKTISICLMLALSLVVIAELLMPPVWAKSMKGGSVDFETKAVIMGKGNDYLVIGGRPFLLTKDLLIKDKRGKEIPLYRIKVPVRALIRYSIQVNDNLATLKSVDLLE